jgi:hypothetical protein
MGKLGKAGAHGFCPGPGLVAICSCRRDGCICSTGILPVGPAGILPAECSNGGRSSATLLPIAGSQELAPPRVRFRDGPNARCARVIPKPSKAVVRSIEMLRAEHGRADCSGSAAHLGRHPASDTAGAKNGRSLLCP